MKKKMLKQKLDRLWKVGKKDLDRILKDTSHLVQKGEDYIKEVSKKGEENLETMVLALQREKLYYELGRSLSSLSKNKWAKSKKVESSLAKIKKISRKIRRLKK